LKLNAPLDNTKSTDNAFQTLPDVPFTVISPNVLNAKLVTPLSVVSVTEHLWPAPEELSSTASLGLVIMSMTNVKNGELMVFVLHVSAPLKSQSTEFVFQLIQPALQLNLLMLKETVLKTIFFVILSKNGEVNV